MLPMKNISYLTFSLRMSSSSLSSSSSCLITWQRIQYAFLRDSTSSLRSIPSVERILSAAAFSGLIDDFGRARVKEAVVAHLDGLRSAREAFDERVAVESVRAALAGATAS